MTSQNALKRTIYRRLMREFNNRHRAKHPPLACFAFDTITARVHLDGRFELDQLQALDRHVFNSLEPGAVCLDIGANVGNHSLFFAESFNRVLAFEPNPRTYKLLQANAMLADNVSTFECGLSDSEGTFDAVFNPENAGGAALASDYPGPHDHLTRTSFSLKPLDSIAEVAALDRLDFVKIDVERHEASAFRGARETLSRFKPIIAMEVLGTEIMDGSTEAIDVLKSYGYNDFSELVDGRSGGSLPRPVAKLATFLKGVVTNRRSARDYVLKPMVLQPGKNYSMILCRA